MARTPPPPLPIGRRAVILVVIALSVVVLIGALAGDRGYLEVRRRRAAYQDLLREVAELQAGNAGLQAQIRALRSDPHVIEKLAREKLGYARPGEVIYLFPPGPAGP
ncbi:MAG TPA: septum formation initiator family protein [Candidatus Polarisedimenticolia bacterium]|nr:septum formation initiator family protein [Candidatus Polarisedimenticolia bacterium]